MALQIISVLLFTVFFSKALTLMCYNCPTIDSSGTCSQTANCSSNSQCSYMTTNNAVSKSCIDSTLCANWSINVGQYNMSSYCCASDRCNNAPVSNSDNGLMCYTCSDTNCSNTQTLKCKGDENRCLTLAVGLDGMNFTFKGCASQNICNNSALTPGIFMSSVSCCGANLCNSAQNITQGPVNNTQNTTQGPVNNTQNTTQGPVNNTQNTTQGPVNNTQNTTQGPVNNAQSTTQGLFLLVPVLFLFFSI